MAMHGPESNMARILGRAHGDEVTCSACYEAIDPEYVVEGVERPLCPACFATTYDTEKYVWAGEDLPLAEVFDHDEIAGLEFVRYLVSVGRLDDDIRPAA